jgi:hypothetical protein
MKGRDHQADVAVCGRRILKSILMKYYIEMWTGFI